MAINDVKFTRVSDQYPPTGVSLLAKDPNGNIHDCNWRPAYNIFTCQDKHDSPLGWSWAVINPVDYDPYEDYHTRED